MPPFSPFAHYLGYGATDQETFRELRDSYDGILVPATIAAWQRQGTGGFVLSLSATDEARPYLIDSRFPLFQQGLALPKQSHRALADLLGDNELIHQRDPTPDDFPDERLAGIATRWVEFNAGYDSTSNEKFAKYAKRLGEDVAPEAAQAPEAILAPYFACGGRDDAWWDRSQVFYRESCRAANDRTCWQVVCARESTALGELLAEVDPASSVAIWVSGLDEHNAPEEALISYRTAISQASDRGQEMFALYGGFFSVLLRQEGLCGAAHGVGFSEHRNWRELPESGAPPARFYLRRSHRYVPQDLAQVLWDESPALTACPCPHCAERNPLDLDYHDLMKHSVWCRAEEIEIWRDIGLADAARLLEDEYDALAAEIKALPLTPRIYQRAMNSVAHLPGWASALASP